MICKECGTELPDIAKFCYRCGKTVGSVDLQDDFDPFGTDDGVMPVKAVAPAVAKADESVKEVDVEVVEETVEEVDVEEAVAPVETVAEAAKEASVKEEAEAESEKTEETTEEKEMIEGAEEAEEAAKANKGFKIMRNPDYVPPEVEEEKPFYEEHVNYEELREQRAAKMEKRMQILSIFIGIAVLIGIGIFAYTKYANYVDFNEKYDAAQALYDAGDYEAAFLAFGELVEHKGADEEEMVCKQYECLEAIGDVARARDFAYTACRKYSSPEIRALLDAATSIQGPTGPSTVAPTPTVEPTIEPTDEPTQEPTQEPTEAPTQEPTDEPTQAPDETPDNLIDEPVVEPDEPKVDVTAYEDTFAQLYTGLEVLRSNADPMAALRIMITEEFAILRDSKQSVAYADGTFSNEVADGDNVLILRDNGYVYYGSVAAGKASGAGVLMVANKDDNGISYYYYRGVWAEGLPTGAGRIEKIDTTTGIKEVVTGKFAKGYYDGTITITGYKGSEEIGKTVLEIVEGVPTSLKDDHGNDLVVDEKPVIGYTTTPDGEQIEVVWDGITKYAVEGMVE